MLWTEKAGDRMKKTMLLIGGGGHAKSIIDSMKSSYDFKIIGILDNGLKLGDSVDNIPVIGQDSDAERYYSEGIKNAFMGIGSVGDPKVRITIYSRLSQLGYQFPNVIDQSAVLAKNIQLGNGNYIGKGAIIGSEARIGHNCIINTGAIIEHECEICDFVHIASGATLCGQVKIGTKTHIGANATIIQNITVGSRCLIGAGSVVLRSISDNIKAYGNPCKEVSRFE